MLILLTIFAIYLNETNGTITRLPCRWHANFSRVEENKRYSGNVFKKTTDLEYTRCLMLCVSETACSFVNFNNHAVTCELLAENENGFIQEKLSTEINWKFAAPAKRSLTAVRVVNFICSV